MPCLRRAPGCQSDRLGRERRNRHLGGNRAGDQQRGGTDRHLLAAQQNAGDRLLRRYRPQNRLAR